MGDAGSAASQSSGSSGISGGAIAGIVVGVIAGLAILALLALFLVRRRRQRSAASIPNKMEAGEGGAGATHLSNKPTDLHNTLAPLDSGYGLSWKEGDEVSTLDKKDSIKTTPVFHLALSYLHSYNYLAHLAQHLDLAIDIPNPTNAIRASESWLQLTFNNRDRPLGSKNQSQLERFPLNKSPRSKSLLLIKSRLCLKI